jgi:hypothetical protein
MDRLIPVSAPLVRH